MFIARCAMKPFLLSALLSINWILFSPSESLAYIGPGAGLGMLGSLFAAVIAVLVSIFGLIVYPFLLLKKKFMKKERTNNKDSQTNKE